MKITIIMHALIITCHVQYAHCSIIVTARMRRTVHLYGRPARPRPSRLGKPLPPPSWVGLGTKLVSAIITLFVQKGRPICRILRHDYMRRRRRLRFLFYSLFKNCESHCTTRMHTPTGSQKYTTGIGRNALKHV